MCPLGGQRSYISWRYVAAAWAGARRRPLNAKQRSRLAKLQWAARQQQQHSKPKESDLPSLHIADGYLTGFMAMILLPVLALLQFTVLRRAVCWNMRSRQQRRWGDRGGQCQLEGYVADLPPGYGHARFSFHDMLQTYAKSSFVTFRMPPAEANNQCEHTEEDEYEAERSARMKRAQDAMETFVANEFQNRCPGEEASQMADPYSQLWRCCLLCLRHAARPNQMDEQRPMEESAQLINGHSTCERSLSSADKKRQCSEGCAVAADLLILGPLHRAQG